MGTRLGRLPRLLLNLLENVAQMLSSHKQVGRHDPDIA